MALGFSFLYIKQCGIISDEGTPDKTRTATKNMKNCGSNNKY